MPIINFSPQVLGGGGIEELLTSEEKKRLEDNMKKRSTSPAEGSSGTSVKTEAMVQQDFGIAAVLAGLLQGTIEAAVLISTLWILCKKVQFRKLM